MRENKKHQLVMLATDNSKLGLVETTLKNWSLILRSNLISDFEKEGRVIPQHLYVFENKLIEEGEWYLDIIHRNPFSWKMGTGIHKGKSAWCDVIVATTNPKLNKDLISDGEYFDSEFKKGLPTLSNEFVQHFITEYNKGNVITEVDVEYGVLKINNTYSGISRLEYELKVSSDNTITIHSAEEKSYTKEEVLNFGKNCFYAGFSKALEDAGNCFTAWREESGNLIEKL